MYFVLALFAGDRRYACVLYKHDQAFTCISEIGRKDAKQWGFKVGCRIIVDYWTRQMYLNRVHSINAQHSLFEKVLHFFKTVFYLTYTLDFTIVFVFFFCRNPLKYILNDFYHLKCSLRVTDVHVKQSCFIIFWSSKQRSSFTNQKTIPVFKNMTQTTRSIHINI